MWDNAMLGFYFAILKSIRKNLIIMLRVELKVNL